MRFVLSIVGVAALLAGPAYATEIQPGLWQDAETAEIAGQVYPPEMMTGCIKPDDAKDIVKAALAHQKELMMNDRPQECSKFDFKQDGDVIAVRDEMPRSERRRYRRFDDHDHDGELAAEHDARDQIDHARGRADKGHQRDDRIEMAFGKLR